MTTDKSSTVTLKTFLSTNFFVYLKKSRHLPARRFSLCVICITCICNVVNICGCRINDESKKKAVIITTYKEGNDTHKIVAFIDPNILRNAGITEEVFRKELFNVYSAFILDKTATLLLEELSLIEPKDSEIRDKPSQKQPLYQSQNKAIQSLLDEGIPAEVQCIKDGNTSVLSQLTITSTGFIERTDTKN